MAVKSKNSTGISRDTAERKRLEDELRRSELAFRSELTERKQAEEALKAANKQMRDIINFLPDATLITVGNEVIAWNRAMEELTGISMEEITGQEYSSVKSLFFSDLLNSSGMNGPDLNARYSSVVRIGSVVHAEAFVPSFYRNRGAHVFAAVSPLLDREGNVIGHIESIRDITKQKQDEEKLYKEEQRFRILTEHSSDIIILVNREGKIIYENPAANLILGLDVEKRIGQSVLDNVHPDDIDLVLKAFHLLFADINAPVQKAERRVRDVNGFWWTFEVVASNLVVEKTVDAIIVNLRDITDRKKAEEALFIIKAAVESSSDAIGLSDPEGHHFYHNKAFTQLFEYTPEELSVMESGREIYADKDFAKTVFDTIMAGGSWSGEINLLTKSGKTFPILLRADAIRDDRGKIIGLLGLHTDITERRKADEEREKLQAQLTQSQKMESVGRLAGGIAHDFNNMLGVILGRAEIALTRIDAAQPIYKDLQEIRKAAERSANLTRQLLAFARRQTVVLKVLDLNETVEGMLKMIRRLIGEDIELAWLPDNVLLPVKMDPGQIDQILANLCVNARDAIAGVGKITIETATAVFDRAFCSRHLDFIPGDFVMIAVSDDGSGMDKATLDKLFEPFFTTKDVGRGTGLGLATVYGIVKQNGGFINVYSEKGRGTTFRIYLPRHAGRAEQFPKEEKVPTVSGGTVVLLVEDEQAILEMTAMMLERLGYTVLAAKMPGEAIALAQMHTEKIHLLMTDVVMPEMNGRDLAKNILTLYPAIKLLFMSGYTADVIAHQGVLDEGVSFIQKPFTISDLAAKLRETLDTTR